MKLPLQRYKEGVLAQKLRKFDNLHSKALRLFERATISAAIATENCRRATQELEDADKKVSAVLQTLCESRVRGRARVRVNTGVRIVLC